MALRRLESESRAREPLERIKTASQRASELTAQMLAYSGRTSFQTEAVDLNRLAHRYRDLDWVEIDAELADLVATAVRMMDNVVDASRFPLPEQAAEAQAKRRIGLGVTGLADALLMVGLRYGSDEAARQTDRWLHSIARAAYLASVDLAKEKSAFPLFDAEKYLDALDA